MSTLNPIFEGWLLAERAQLPPEDQLQRRAIQSILSMFETAGAGVGHGGDGAALTTTTFQVSDPTAITLLDELRRTLSSDKELAARADQLRYLHAAKSALEREAAALGSLSSAAVFRMIEVLQSAVRTALDRLRPGADEASPTGAHG